jgi:hypothetical protein
VTEIELKNMEGAVAAYQKAIETHNDRAAHAQSLYMQKNAIDWIPKLFEENRAFRCAGIKAEAAIALDSLDSPPMKAIYVCSAIRGNIPKCLTSTRRSCKVLIDMGYIPIAPFVMFSEVLNYENILDRSIGMTLGLELIRFCSELWIFSKRATEEMQKEIERAIVLKIPTRRMVDL